MRKPRDYDSELKALGDKAKQLKERRVQQLGELVAATGADAMPIEQLAGALLGAVDTTDSATKEGWRKRGAAFFQGSRRAQLRRALPPRSGGRDRAFRAHIPCERLILRCDSARTYGRGMDGAHTRRLLPGNRRVQV